MVVVLPLAGCAATLAPAHFAGDAQPKIVGWNAQNRFVDELGGTFFPWGFNYTNPEGLGLIDDELYAERTWQVIAEDFAEMRGYSANTVRVHLQYHRFMRDPVTPDEQAFAALERLVDIAQGNGIYLVITGLGAYRKADSPAWYDSLSTTERWQTQALFWATLAQQVGHRRAVFAFDLMNEPVVAACIGDAPCTWQVGDPLGGYHFVQNISLEPGLPFRETLSTWIGLMKNAVRQVDATTLVTVGLLSTTPLSFFGDHLDFTSAHVYPECGELQESVKYLRNADRSRPLVIGEFFNLFCNVDDLESVLEAVAGRYHGVLGHYDGQTMEELEASANMADLLRLEFLRFFVANRPAAR